MAENDAPKRSNRGFASMDQAKQRAIASKGGLSVPAEKRSFSQDPQLAAQAGRKGGKSVPPEGRSFSLNRNLAAEAGRKGGQARGLARERDAIKRKEDAARDVKPSSDSTDEPDDIDRQSASDTQEFVRPDPRGTSNSGLPGVRN